MSDYTKPYSKYRKSYETDLALARASQQSNDDPLDGIAEKMEKPRGANLVLGILKFLNIRGKKDVKGHPPSEEAEIRTGEFKRTDTPVKQPQVRVVRKIEEPQEEEQESELQESELQKQEDYFDAQGNYHHIVKQRHEKEYKGHGV